MTATEGLMRLEADGCSLAIDPEAGGRLTSLVVDGRELIVQTGRDVYHWGSFVMAPWVGRMRGGSFAWEGREYTFPKNAGEHALHGLVTTIPWQAAGPGTVAVDLPEPWPWRGRLVHSVRLEPGLAEFRLELQAAERMPAALGWHPWFVRQIAGAAGEAPVAGPVVLEAEPRAMYGNDETGLPTGTLVPPVGLPWDYAFVQFPRPPRAVWPGFLELEVDTSCPIYVLYEWEPQGICIEPWTAPPNSLNLPGQAVVEAGESLVATMTWRWRRLGEPEPR